MSRTAVLVDLSFFLVQYGRHRHPPGQAMIPSIVANAVCNTARSHVHRGDELHRILVYDCKPLTKKTHNPISRRAIDFSRSGMFSFRHELHRCLTSKRKVALRLGELADRNRWLLREEPTRRLITGVLRADELTESDVRYDVEQKGVDMKLGIDIASLAYKRLVDRIVLITGDADFVPAAKLARREGLDVVLDPLWAPIAPSLNEHVDGLVTHWSRRTSAAPAMMRARAAG